MSLSSQLRELLGIEADPDGDDEDLAEAIMVGWGILSESQRETWARKMAIHILTEGR